MDFGLEQIFFLQSFSRSEFHCNFVTFFTCFFKEKFNLAEIFSDFFCYYENGVRKSNFVSFRVVVVNDILACEFIICRRVFLYDLIELMNALFYRPILTIIILWTGSTFVGFEFVESTFGLLLLTRLPVVLLGKFDIFIVMDWLFNVSEWLFRITFQTQIQLV